MLFSTSVVLLVRDRLKPFIAGFSSGGDVGGDMLEPTVLCRAVPMLHAFRNVNHIPSLQLDGRLSPFLVPAFAADADQDLSCSVMNMPTNVPRQLLLWALGNIFMQNRRRTAPSFTHEERICHKVLPNNSSWMSRGTYSCEIVAI